MTEIPTPPSKYFLTLKEAAAIIGKGRTFMYELLHGQQDVEPPRFVRIGRDYRIPTAEFMDWVNRQTQTPKGKS